MGILKFIVAGIGWHKSPFLRELRKRDDIVLLEAGGFLDRSAMALENLGKHPEEVAAEQLR